jgi:hypothetical protein
VGVALRDFWKAGMDLGRSLMTCLGRIGRGHPVITSVALGAAILVVMGQHELSLLFLAVNYEKLYRILFGE